MRTRLAIKLDHIATLRQARGGRSPEPVAAAHVAELAGAEQVTVHLRRDRRHVQVRDVRLLRETVLTRLNVEVPADEIMVAEMLELQPDTVTFVHEDKDEVTTSQGYDLVHHEEHIGELSHRLMDHGIAVAVQIAPELAQVDAAHRLELDGVDLHVAQYAWAEDDEAAESALGGIARTAEHAAGCGLMVTAGGGLDFMNVREVASVAEIESVTMGHALLARAVFVGLERSVRELTRILASC